MALLKEVPDGAELVEITEIIHASAFWVIKSESSSETKSEEWSKPRAQLEMLEMFLASAKLTSVPRNRAPRLQEIVAVNHPLTGKWHRGCVQAVKDPNKCLYYVFLIDHGHTVEVSASALRDIDEYYKKQEPLANQILLFGIVPGKRTLRHPHDKRLIEAVEWTAEAIAFVKNQIAKSSMGYFCQKGKHNSPNTLFGDLYLVADEGFLDLGLLLCLQKYAISSLHLFLGKYARDLKVVSENNSNAFTSSTREVPSRASQSSHQHSEDTLSDEPLQPEKHKRQEDQKEQVLKQSVSVQGSTRRESNRVERLPNKVSNVNESLQVSVNFSETTFKTKSVKYQFSDEHREVVNSEPVDENVSYTGVQNRNKRQSIPLRENFETKYRKKVHFAKPDSQDTFSDSLKWTDDEGKNATCKMWNSEKFQAEIIPTKKSESSDINVCNTQIRTSGRSVKFLGRDVERKHDSCRNFRKEPSPQKIEQATIDEGKAQSSQGQTHKRDKLSKHNVTWDVTESDEGSVPVKFTNRGARKSLSPQRMDLKRIESTDTDARKDTFEGHWKKENRGCEASDSVAPHKSSIKFTNRSARRPVSPQRMHLDRIESTNTDARQDTPVGLREKDTRIYEARGSVAPHKGSIKFTNKSVRKSVSPQRTHLDRIESTDTDAKQDTCEGHWKSENSMCEASSSVAPYKGSIKFTNRNATKFPQRIHLDRNESTDTARRDASERHWKSENRVCEVGNTAASEGGSVKLTNRGARKWGTSVSKFGQQMDLNRIESASSDARLETSGELWDRENRAREVSSTVVSPKGSIKFMHRGARKAVSPQRMDLDGMESTDSDARLNKSVGFTERDNRVCEIENSAASHKGSIKFTGRGAKKSVSPVKNFRQRMDQNRFESAGSDARLNKCDGLWERSNRVYDLGNVCDSHKEATNDKQQCITETQLKTREKAMLALLPHGSDTGQENRSTSGPRSGNLFDRTEMFDNSERLGTQKPFKGSYQENRSNSESQIGDLSSSRKSKKPNLIQTFFPAGFNMAEADKVVSEKIVPQSSVKCSGTSSGKCAGSFSTAKAENNGSMFKAKGRLLADNTVSIFNDPKCRDSEDRTPLTSCENNGTIKKMPEKYEGKKQRDIYEKEHKSMFDREKTESMLFPTPSVMSRIDHIALKKTEVFSNSFEACKKEEILIKSCLNDKHKQSAHHTETGTYTEDHAETKTIQHEATLNLEKSYSHDNLSSKLTVKEEVADMKTQMKALYNEIESCESEYKKDLSQKFSDRKGKMISLSPEQQLLTTREEIEHKHMFDREEETECSSTSDIPHKNQMGLKNPDNPPLCNLFKAYKNVEMKSCMNEEQKQSAHHTKTETIQTDGTLNLQIPNSHNSQFSKLPVKEEVTEDKKQVKSEHDKTETSESECKKDLSPDTSDRKSMLPLSPEHQLLEAVKAVKECIAVTGISDVNQNDCVSLLDQLLAKLKNASKTESTENREVQTSHLRNTNAEDINSVKHSKVEVSDAVPRATSEDTRTDYSLDTAADFSNVCTDLIDSVPLGLNHSAPCDINDLALHAPNERALHTELVIPAEVETAEPAPEELPKYATLELEKPASLEPAKPTLVDYAKPAPFDPAKPVLVDPSVFDPVKPALVDTAMPATVDMAVPTPVDPTEPVPVDLAEPAPVDSAEPAPVDLAKTAMFDLAKPAPFDPTKCVPIDLTKPAPFDPSISDPTEGVLIDSTEPAPVDSAEHALVDLPEPGPVDRAELGLVDQVEPEPVDQAEHAPVDQAEPAPIDQAEPAPVDKARPAPIDLAKPAPVDQARPAPIDLAKPAPIDLSKPAPVDQARPAPIDLAKPAPVDQARPAPIDLSKPAPVDEVRPSPIDQTEPAPVEQARPSPIDQTEPAPVEQARPAPIDRAEPEPVYQAEPAPDDVNEPTTLKPAKSKSSVSAECTTIKSAEPSQIELVHFTHEPEETKPVTAAASELAKSLPAKLAQCATDRSLFDKLAVPALVELTKSAPADPTVFSPGECTGSSPCNLKSPQMNLIKTAHSDLVNSSKSVSESTQVQDHVAFEQAGFVPRSEPKNLMKTSTPVKDQTASPTTTEKADINTPTSTPQHRNMSVEPDPCPSIIRSPGRKIMDQLQLSVVLLHGAPKDFRYLNIVTDAILRRDVHEVLKTIMNRLMRIQKYAWPLLQQDHSCVIVGPPMSGKTLGYAVPLLDQVMQKVQANEIPKGNGPVMLVLCSGSKCCNEIFEIFYQFVKKCAKEIKMLVAYGGGAEKIEFSLINGCHILITTPRCFKRLLQLGSVVVNFARLKYLVLDQADVLTLRFLPEVDFISKRVERNMKPQERKKLQVVAVAEKWCPGLEFIVKGLSNPVVCIGAFLEAIVYAHLKPRVHFVTQSNKISVVQEVIKEARKDHRTLVVCKEVEEVVAVYKALQSTVDPKHLIMAHHNLDSIDIHELYVKWSCMVQPVLVCSDVIVQEMSIQGATQLIHFSLTGVSKREFAYRCSTLIDQLPSIFEREEDKGSKMQSQMHIFIADDDSEPLPTLVRFLKRVGVTVDPDLQKRANIAEIQKDLKKDCVPLCTNTKAFGDCWNKANCPLRHVISSADKPRNIPMCGNVKVKVLHVLDVCNYAARVYERTNENGQMEVVPNLLTSITRKMHSYFKDDGHRILKENPKAYDICAAERVRGFYHRVEVLAIVKTDRHDNPTEILVRYIDDGCRELIKADRLFEVPPELIEIPPQCVDIFVCRLAPCDLDWSWGSVTIDKAADILRETLQKDRFLIGKIKLSLRHTLWLDPLECYERLVTLKTSTIIFSLRRKLLEAQLAVESPQHLELLSQACARAGIEVPQYAASNTSLHAEKSEKVDVSWAHLPADEFSLVYFIVGDHPGRFYVRQEKFEDLVHKMDKKLTKLAQERNSNSRTLFAGDYCIGRFPEDKRWYRAHVENSQNDTLDLFFVDHGDRATVSRSEAVPLPKDLITQLPFQAIECCFAGVSPDLGDRWSEKSIDALYGITAKAGTVDAVKLLYAKVLDKVKPADCTGGYKYHVALIEVTPHGQALLNNSLVAWGLASQSEEQKLLLQGLDLSHLTPPMDRDCSYESEDDEMEEEEDEKSLKSLNGSEVIFEDNWDCEPSESSNIQLSDMNSSSVAYSLESTATSTEARLEDTFASFDFSAITEDEIMEFFEKSMEDYNTTSKAATSNAPSSVVVEDREELQEDGSSQIHATVDESEKEEKEDLNCNQQNPIRASSEKCNPSCSLNVENEEHDTHSTSEDDCMPHLVRITRTPLVYWRQDAYFVWLVVDLPGVDNYYLRWDEDHVHFWTVVKENVYSFDLHLFGPIVPTSLTHSGGLFVRIKMQKVFNGTDWLRLVVGSEKLLWLKRHYDAENTSDMEEIQLAEQLRIIKEMEKKKEDRIEKGGLLPADEATYEADDSDSESSSSDVLLADEQYDPYDPLN